MLWTAGSNGRTGKRTLDPSKLGGESHDCHMTRPGDAEHALCRVDRPATFKKKDSATQQLLAWCQHKTKYYEVRGHVLCSIYLGMGFGVC